MTTENRTYSLSATNGENFKVSVSISNLTEQQVLAVLNNCEYGFRDIEVVCEQTGEIMYNRYWSGEWFDKFRKPWTPESALTWMRDTLKEYNN